MSLFSGWTFRLNSSEASPFFETVVIIKGVDAVPLQGVGLGIRPQTALLRAAREISNTSKISTPDAAKLDNSSTIQRQLITAEPNMTFVLFCNMGSNATPVQFTFWLSAKPMQLSKSALAFLSQDPAGFIADNVKAIDGQIGSGPNGPNLGIHQLVVPGAIPTKRETIQHYMLYPIGPLSFSSGPGVYILSFSLSGTTLQYVPIIVNK